MERTKIIADFNDTFSNLERVVSSFNEADFNEIPFENSWTPGQVVQHIILASEGLAGLLNAAIEETNRPIDEKIPSLKSLFLDFELKMNSPEFILPAFKPYDQQEQLDKIKQIKTEGLQAIETLDLSKTCLAFELPTFGHLTRLELAYFVNFHTQRHTHQLKRIDETLKSRKS